MNDDVKPAVLFEEVVPPAGMWSWVLRRHQTLRLTDLQGGANVAMLLFNRDLLIERYNMADTLKAQHTALLTRGHALYSDMGRILCSITQDSVGWHDTFTGLSDAASVRAQYGEKSYGVARNEWYRNAHDEFLVELGKYGLGQRDLVPNLNLFSKVAPDEEGNLKYIEGHSQPGGSIDLRAEMNVLVVMNTCPHVLDPAVAGWAPKPVSVQVLRTPAPGPDDVCRRSRPENERGFINTENLFLGE
jgi:urea carboxylase-associated protein 2